MTWARACIHVPAVGETMPGDDFCILETAESLLIAVVDGLGHGEEAAHASRLAVRYVRANPDRPLKDMMEGCHRELRGSRGAAVAITRVFPARQVLTHAAVGNVETRIIGADKVRRPVAVAGIVGYQVRKIHVEDFAFHPGDLLAMYSDGISDRFDVAPASRTTDLELLASQIAHGHGKANDDQTLVLARLDA